MHKRKWDAPPIKWWSTPAWAPLNVALRAAVTTHLSKTSCGKYPYDDRRSHKGANDAMKESGGER